MKLRKRFLPVILAVAMVVSSLQVPEMTLWAKELSGETVVIEDLSGEQESAEESETRDIGDSEQPESDLEEFDSDDAKEHTAETDEGGTDGTEMTGNGTETTEEEITETDTVESETTEEVQTAEGEEEPDLPIRIVEDELDGVYQFGGAPTESASSEEDAVDVHTLAAENEISVEEYIYREALKKSSEINILSYNILEDNLANIVSGVLNEHPDLYFVENGYSYSLSGTTVHSIYLTYNTSLDDNAFKEEVDTALSTVKGGMSDLQKAIVLHDYLTVNCEYDLDRLNSDTLPKVSYSAYGVLVNRMAVCEGYALAYKYLLNQVGINCYMVTSDEMNHAWNLIELDGQYYQVDVTWDDPIRDLIGRSVHKYMFRSDEQLEGHNNWVVTSGSDVVDYKAVDTRYDTAFWADVTSPLVFAGDNWQDCYYVACDNPGINRTTLSDNAANAGSSICSIDKWTVWDNDNSYWQGAYSGLFQYNNRLYYNDKLSIYSIAFDGSDKQTEFTPDTAEGYIYGSALCQGKVLYSLHQDPNLSAKETVLEADISIQGPEKKPYIKARKDKTEYQCGDTIDLSDLTVTYYDEKGEGQEVTGYTTNADEIDMETAGTKELVITYNGITTTITLTVMEAYIAQGSYEGITWSIDGSGKLVVTGSGDFSGDTGQSRAPWYQWRAQIKSAEIGVTGMTDASYMFFDCSNLAAADFSGFNTVAVTNMTDMFSGCRDLSSLDLSSFDVSNVTNMDRIFDNCNSLNYLHTPQNVSVSAALPSGTWHDSDGKTYAELPKLAYSILLAKNEIPSTSQAYITAIKSKTEYKIGEIIDLSDLTVIYHEMETQQIVTGYTTNADKIDMTTAGTKDLIITYRELTVIITLTVTESEESGSDEKKPYIMAVKGKTQYKRWEMLGLSDLTVTYYEKDGTSRILEPAEYQTNADRIDMTVVGTKDLVITYHLYTTTIRLTVVENKDGLKVVLADPDEVYVYTGAAIIPKIVVTHNGRCLREGTDYSVKYTNNVKASQTAKITVTGKGNLTGSKTMEFTISPKMLDNGDNTVMRVEGSSVTVLEGAKASPILLYGGAKLTAKDFQLKDSADKNYKWKAEDSGRTISVTGKGNFTGVRTLSVNVISKEQQRQRKLMVSLSDDIKTLTYNGEPIDMTGYVGIYTPETPVGDLVENRDYMISWPTDMTSSGTRKFTVVGISDRCIGTVTKSYTVKPKKTAFDVTFNKTAGYPYVSTGSTIDDLIVKDGARRLTEGVDYKVSYSNNKKAGNAAKFKVTGLGNYKGSTYNNGRYENFTIRPGSLKDAAIVAGDMVFNKEGVYKSVPYVSIHGIAVKSSEYQVTYYLEDPRTTAAPRVMDHNNKITAGGTRVWVKITGKNNRNYAASDDDDYAAGSYMVCSKDSGFDLSKAKVSFYKDGKKINKVAYTGNPITESDIEVRVTYKVNGINETVDPGDYTVKFTNNVNKGKATVVVIGNGDQYIGSKTGAFSIGATNLKDVLGLFE